MEKVHEAFKKNRFNDVDKLGGVVWDSSGRRKIEQRLGYHTSILDSTQETQSDRYQKSCRAILNYIAIQSEKAKIMTLSLHEEEQKEGDNLMRRIRTLIDELNLIPMGRTHFNQIQNDS